MSVATLVRRWVPILTTAVMALTIAGVVVVFGALAFGYRPVVITTGSMGDAAPTGSLVVAAPRAVDDIAAGDVVVMRRPGAAPVTHRVVSIERADERPFAITRGDANSDVDPLPYPLGDDELVARWVVPGFGSALAALRDPRLLLGAMSLLMAVGAGWWLRRIWSGSRSDAPAPSDDVRDDPEHRDDRDVDRDDEDPHLPSGPESASVATPEPPVATPEPSVVTSATSSGARGVSRMQVGATMTLASVLVCVGVVWSLHSASLAVDSNLFGTADCFGAQLRSVQSGETVHATSGVVAAPIAAVDPSRSFVMASVRSSSNDVADSVVRVRLAGNTTVELRRESDAATPPPVTVAWSVVEYECGLAVQRGVVAGDGSNQVDVPITPVDTASSFVLANHLAPANTPDFGANELYVAELSSPGTVSIRGAGSAAFAADQSFAWQVVTFQHASEIDVQTVAATFGVGDTSDTVTLPTPVDPDTTFLTTFVTSDATGADIGERLVRARLVDATTVAVDRSVAGDPVDVHIQVVTLMDGTTVRHGTVDLVAGVGSRDVAVAPVDPARSTAISTVAVPGLVAGGMTDHVVDDVVGEASATFALSGPSTVTITRDATASNASFGWQVIEWAGPSWWDPDYTFRQRIVVDSTVAAPGDYTVSLPIDHAALISSDLSLASGDDLRILRWDGSSWIELDRVLDDDSAWALNDTTVRFRTTDPIAAGQNQIYWLYMANPAAGAAPSDPEAVYLLVEDFETGDLGDFEDRTAGTGWYSASPWTRRIQLTIPAGAVGSTLSDFPLLVSIADADLAANAQPDGSDIRFTSADGTTDLSHEIEAYDPGTGSLTAWVRVPTVSASTATTVHLYYGAVDAPSREDVHGTWSDEVEAAWHLDRDPAGTAPQLDDSSQRNHDGLSIGAMTGADLVPGLVGRAIHLDGTDDGFQVDRMDLEGRTAFTISAWVRLDASSTDASVFSKADDASNRQVDLVVGSGGSVSARLLLDGGEVQASSAAATVGVGDWHHVAATWDGTDLAVVVDGTSRASAAASGAIVPRYGMPVHIGNVVTQDRSLGAVLDEVRVETVARSIDWLAAVEANQRTPATFVVAGAVATGTWFDQGAWSLRKPVVVDADQVPADVADYPLLVQIVDAEIQASAQASACDLVFTGADGTTRLDHVVEAFDPGTGALTAWVSVPVLSGSEDTQLFLYYGNPTAVDQQDPSAVFGSDADLQILGAP